MIKKYWPYYTILAVLLIFGLVYYLLPRKEDWRLTYEKKDKIPYGDYLVQDLLPTLFPDQKISTNYKRPSVFYNILEYTEYSEVERPDDYVNYNPDDYEEGKSGHSTISNSDSTNAWNESSTIPEIVVHYPNAHDTTNYIIVNEIFSPKYVDADALLNHVAGGNHVFVAAELFGGQIAWQFNLATSVINLDSLMDIGGEFDLPVRTDTMRLSFLSKKLSTHSKQYTFVRGNASNYFTRYDKHRATVLSRDQFGRPTYLAMRYGKGAFYFSSTPQVFTNYNMLKDDNIEYISKCFSYLPVKNTYWDEYYKKYKPHYYARSYSGAKRSGSGSSRSGTGSGYDKDSEEGGGEEEDRSLLSFIFDNPPLIWSFWLILAGIALYMLFASKRKQRLIPVHEQARNNTVDFVQTVGQLYYQNGNHKDMAYKKILFFAEQVRAKYMLDSRHMKSDEFAQRLSEKSGVPLSETLTMTQYLEHIAEKPVIDASDLVRLDGVLERFRKKSGM